METTGSVSGDFVDSVAVADAKRGARLKRLFSMTLLFFLIPILFGACRGDDGDVSIRFTHGTGFYFFFYDDPNLPDTVFTFTTYRTQPGSYYVEWTYDNSDPPYWFASYRIKADEGGAFWSDGDDRTFEFYMGRGDYDFGQLSADEVQPSPIMGTRGRDADRLPIDMAEARVIGSYTQRSGRYTLEVTIFEQGAPDSGKDDE